MGKQIAIAQLERKAVGNIAVHKKEIAAFRQQHRTQLNPLQYHVVNLLISSKAKAWQVVKKTPCWE